MYIIQTMNLLLVKAVLTFNILIFLSFKDLKTMANYVGFANLPNQVHRKSVKKGFEFTLMVVGEYSTSSFNNNDFVSD